MDWDQEAVGVSRDGTSGTGIKDNKKDCIYQYNIKKSPKKLHLMREQVYGKCV